MKPHVRSVMAILVMVILALGSVDTKSTQTPPAPPGNVGTPATASDAGASAPAADGNDATEGPRHRPVVAASESGATLILEDWRFTTEYGFVKVTGQVTNNTSSRIENVTAVATFYTSDGRFVKSSEAIISYNPVLSGQTSPFEVIDTGNPAIQKASVAFKSLFGGTIATKTREDMSKPTPEEIERRRKADEKVARARAEADAKKKAAIEAAKWRTWTTADGKHEVNAKYVKFANGMCTLEKEDGKTVDVKLDSLSSDDQDFVKRRKWAREKK